MHTIARDFFLETSLHTLTAEISELVHGKQLEGRQGLPRKFVMPGVGNGQPFVAIAVERSGGDLQLVKYRQMLGCVEAIIFND
jgi:hypothetical protein